MPAQKFRLKVRAPSLELTTGVNRDLFIPWQDILLAASGVAAATGASMSASAATASGPLALLVAGASSGCFLNIPLGRVPQDIATSGPAAGSGTVFVDWTSSSVNGAAATFAACLLHIPSGSEYTATGASQRLGSGCVTATGASIGQINSSSVINFNSPPDRTGLWALRIQFAGQDNAQTVASSLHVYGIRVRYKADRLGS